jgi:glycosyltransferase involved in cell wall biosynthesis
MRNHSPRVSIGLPVYNGEKFLRESIDSILAQTCSDFELIISDNASTDTTAEICQAYVDSDPRVKYYRNPENIGGFRNHNRVVELSSGEFFMWASHDDRRASDFVAKCLAVLDSCPEVVLCYTKIMNIDEDGSMLDSSEVALDTATARVDLRFREMIGMEHHIEPIFGLMRLQQMRQTRLQGQFPDSDRVFLAELSLYGPFHQIPEPLYFRRDHPQGSIRLYPSRQERMAWIDPASRPRITLPHFRELWELLKTVYSAPIRRRERYQCYIHLLNWLVKYHNRLVIDINIAVRIALRPLVSLIRG